MSIYRYRRKRLVQQRSQRRNRLSAWLTGYKMTGPGAGERCQNGPGSKLFANSETIHTSVVPLSPVSRGDL